MGAIELCRTAAPGGHTETCPSAASSAAPPTRAATGIARSEGQARAEWLAARQAELLPVPHFHVVFTLPAPVAEIAFPNKATVYAILFRTAAETLRTIAADPKHLGAEIGLVAVLHTWGQNLHHHRHVHCVVPGGGPWLDDTRWVACRQGFFLPVRVLSRLFRRRTPIALAGIVPFAVKAPIRQVAGLAAITGSTASLAQLCRPPSPPPPAIRRPRSSPAAADRGTRTNRHRHNPHSRAHHPAGSLNSASMRSRSRLRPTPVPRDLIEASRFKQLAAHASKIRRDGDFDSIVACEQRLSAFSHRLDPPPRFAPSALNAGFRPHCRRSRDRDGTAGVDPEPPFVACGDIGRL